MALPGREKTFALENCRDLLEKLDREIKRFCAADDVTARIDHAFNTVITAWHLCDWVFADLTPVQKSALNITHLGDLQAKVRRECRALHLCQQAANASKHWKVTKYPDPNVAVIVTASPIPERPASVPQVPLYIGPSWYLYFTDGSEIQAAEDVFELAIGFWTGFIYQNEIAKNDPELQELPQ